MSAWEEALLLIQMQREAEDRIREQEELDRIEQAKAHQEQ